MAQPYVGEIRLFAGNFAPEGWAFCEGQLLPISRERDPVQPDRHHLRRRRPDHLRAARPAGRVPVHQGTRLHVLGQNGGAETVTLTAHRSRAHATRCSPAPRASAARTARRTSRPARRNGSLYISGRAPTNDERRRDRPVGGSQPHDNMQPYRRVNFIISLFGIFPSQN